MNAVNAAILVVDDSPVTCEAVENLLQSEGCRVSSAGNGLEALERVESARFDLILLDIMMPGMDGLEACAKIHQHWQTPIMMVSALDQPDIIAHAYYLGADDYLVQPYNDPDLRMRIGAILQRSSIEPEPLPLSTRVSAKALETGAALTRIEARLLAMLVQSSNVPSSKDDIFRHVWGYEPQQEGPVLVDAAVRRLRQKIESDASDVVLVRAVDEDHYVFGLS